LLKVSKIYFYYFIIFFYKDFDILRCGYVTKSQFLRGLDGIGVSGLDRLFLSDSELQSLCDSYADEHDCSRINWNSFENEIDKGK